MDPKYAERDGVLGGKAPARRDSRTLQLRHYLTRYEAPESCEWTTRVALTLGTEAPWGMLGSDEAGTCVFAAIAHATMAITGAGDGDQQTPTAEQVIEAYSAFSGYDPANPDETDRGAEMLPALKWWQQGGFGSPAGPYVEIDPREALLVRFALSELGPLLCGLMMPLAWKGRTTWDVPPNAGAAAAEWAPGSWGLHAVAVLSCNAGGVIVCSWGRLILVTWAALAAYSDELYGAIPFQLIRSGAVGPQGLDVAGLVDALRQVAELGLHPVVMPLEAPPLEVVAVVALEAPAAPAPARRGPTSATEDGDGPGLLLTRVAAPPEGAEVESVIEAPTEANPAPIRARPLPSREAPFRRAPVQGGHVIGHQNPSAARPSGGNTMVAIPAQQPHNGDGGANPGPGGHRKDFPVQTFPDVPAWQLQRLKEQANPPMAPLPSVPGQPGSRVDIGAQPTQVRTNYPVQQFPTVPAWKPGGTPQGGQGGGR